MLTDCPDDAKCIIMWSLKNGSEITRITRNDDVLSFACSPDGRLLAISHSMGSICFVDVRDPFRTVPEQCLEDNLVCGMIKFSPDCRCLFCFLQTLAYMLSCFRLNVDIAEHPSYTLDDLSGLSYMSWELNSPSVAGFLLGDPPSSLNLAFDFVLDTVTVLRANSYRNFVDMLNINQLRRTVEETKRVFHSLPRFTTVETVMMNLGIKIRLITRRSISVSLTGETVYVLSTDARNPKATAWDVSSEEPVGQVGILNNSCLEAHMKGGILLSTFQGCLDMWNFDLSDCVRRWFDIYFLDRTTEMIPISEERVALRHKNKVIILNTTTSEIVSILVDHGYVVSCNSKC